MKRGETQSPRENLDFYPTPEDVTLVVWEWLRARGVSGPMLDPAAGDGALIAACSGVPWTGIELDPARAAQLRALPSLDVIEGDALALSWPDSHVIANPPFSLLDAFWCAAACHRAALKRWAAIFCPVAWFSAEKRREYVRPDHILQLGWRPVFRRTKTGPGHKGSQDFVWNILAPEPLASTTWERVNRRASSADPVNAFERSP